MKGTTMLPKISVSRRCGAILANVQNYRMLISDELSEELSQLARELRDVRICHLNSTAFGGGVAECGRRRPSWQDRPEAFRCSIRKGSRTIWFTVSKPVRNASST